VGSSDDSGRDLAGHPLENPLGAFAMTADGFHKQRETKARIKDPKISLTSGLSAIKKQSTTTELEDNLRIIFAKRDSRGSKDGKVSSTNQALSRETHTVQNSSLKIED